MQKVFEHILIALVLTSAIACSGGGDGGKGGDNGIAGGDRNDPGSVDEGSDTVTDKERVGSIVLNSQSVSGIQYKTETKSGVTNASGQYTFIDGEQVEFFLGSTKLGSGSAKTKPTAIGDLDFGIDKEQAELVSNYHINFVRMLLILDTNGNAADGINVDQSYLNVFVDEQYNIDFSVALDLFVDEVNELLLKLEALKGEVVNLPDEDQIYALFENSTNFTELCKYAGAYEAGYELIYSDNSDLDRSETVRFVFGVPRIEGGRLFRIDFDGIFYSPKFGNIVDGIVHTFQNDGTLRVVDVSFSPNQYTFRMVNPAFAIVEGRPIVELSSLAPIRVIARRLDTWGDLKYRISGVYRQSGTVDYNDILININHDNTASGIYIHHEWGSEGRYSTLSGSLQGSLLNMTSDEGLTFEADLTLGDAENSGRLFELDSETDYIVDAHVCVL